MTDSSTLRVPAHEPGILTPETRPALAYLRLRSSGQAYVRGQTQQSRCFDSRPQSPKTAVNRPVRVLATQCEEGGCETVEGIAANGARTGAGDGQGLTADPRFH